MDTRWYARNRLIFRMMVGVAVAAGLAAAVFVVLGKAGVIDVGLFCIIAALACLEAIDIRDGLHAVEEDAYRESADLERQREAAKASLEGRPRDNQGAWDDLNEASNRLAELRADKVWVSALDLAIGRHQRAERKAAKKEAAKKKE